MSTSGISNVIFHNVFLFRMAEIKFQHFTNNIWVTVFWPASSIRSSVLGQFCPSKVANLASSSSISLLQENVDSSERLAWGHVIGVLYKMNCERSLTLPG